MKNKKNKSFKNRRKERGFVLVVGVAISLIQALTQVQEMTLTFVPKILAIFGTIFVMFPLMIVTMTNFMNKIADKIIGIG